MLSMAGGNLLFRTLLAWIVGLFLTLLFFIPVPFIGILDRSGRVIHYIGSIWSGILLFLCGVKVEVEGLENLLKDMPQVLISNHQEAFDIPVLHAFLPIQYRWISKEQVFKIPIIGWTMSLAGYIKMDRSSSRTAYRALEDAAERLKDGISVLIFPEGTRSKSDHINDFKRGPFLIAIRSKVPIVPISIKGTHAIMRDGLPWIHPSKVKIFIGSPVSTDDLHEKEAAALKEDVFRIVSENFEKLELQ